MSSEYKDIRDNAKDSKSSQLIDDIGLVNDQNKKMPCSAYMWNTAFFVCKCKRRIRYGYAVRGCGRCVKCRIPGIFYMMTDDI